MTHLFSLIPSLWIHFILISRVVCTNAFHRDGLLRRIPKMCMFSSLLNQKRGTLYIPPAILPEEDKEDVMDHGELEWDFLPENISIPFILPSIITETNHTQTITIIANPFVIQWVRLCLVDYLRITSMYNDCEDPSQTIFLFV